MNISVFVSLMFLAFYSSELEVSRGISSNDQFLPLRKMRLIYKVFPKVDFSPRFFDMIGDIQELPEQKKKDFMAGLVQLNRPIEVVVDIKNVWADCSDYYQRIDQSSKDAIIKNLGKEDLSGHSCFELVTYFKNDSRRRLSNRYRAKKNVVLNDRFEVLKETIHLENVFQNEDQVKVFYRDKNHNLSSDFGIFPIDFPNRNVHTLSLKSEQVFDDIDQRFVKRELNLSFFNCNEVVKTSYVSYYKKNIKLQMCKGDFFFRVINSEHYLAFIDDIQEHIEFPSDDDLESFDLKDENVSGKRVGRL